MGPTEHPFQVHLGIVTQQCKVMAAAFRVDEKTGHGFQEGKERSMSLPEESVDLFRLFVHWLYTGRCPSGILRPKIEAKKDKPAYDLVDLFIFGDKYDVPQLRLSCLEELIHVFSWTPVPYWSLATHAYKTTQMISPLRKLFAVAYATRLSADYLKKEVHAKELIDSPEFAVDLVGVLSERNNQISNASRRALLDAVLSDAKKQEEQ